MPELFYEYHMAEIGWRRVYQLWYLGRRRVCRVLCTVLSSHPPFFDGASRLVAAASGPTKVKVVLPSFAVPALVRSN